MAKLIDKQATELRRAKVERVQIVLGYAIVTASVIAGFVMSFWPRVFGMEQSNPAIGIGLAVLAGFRLWALRRELRRQALEPDEMQPVKKPRRRAR